jgi:hypothetical protein
MASAVHKKQSESKYVTCFADSNSKTDITFRDVLLSRPADHYLVGIDNFSMTNTSLSMIEPQTGHYGALIRIVKNVHTTHTTGVPPTADILSTHLDRNLPQLYVADFGFDLSIQSTDVILSIQQLMHRLSQMAADTNLYMNSGHCIAGAAGDFEFGYVQNPAGDTTEHLKFEVASDGHVTAIGTQAFWGCFSIEVPSVRNQFGFFGSLTTSDVDIVHSATRLRRFLSVLPDTGYKLYTKILATRFPKHIPTERAFHYDLNGVTKLYDETQAAFVARVTAAQTFNRIVIGGADPLVFVRVSPIANAALFNTHSGINAHKLLRIQFGASVFSSLERRIALEVGCSLPIKNSPMIDHEKETPDFVLGRWIWRTDPRIESNDAGGARRYQSAMPACTEYQGAQDRITYHELQAQAKIQTLRIKLFARLRTFDELTEKWSMRVIELPTKATDWWHTRLHFMSKD